MCRRLLAAATSIDCTTDARQLAVLIGRTTPVVPRIEIPPRMPIRAFSVFLASLLAAGDRDRDLDARARAARSRARSRPPRRSSGGGPG